MEQSRTGYCCGALEEGIIGYGQGNLCKEDAFRVGLRRISKEKLFEKLIIY